MTPIRRISTAVGGALAALAALPVAAHAAEGAGSPPAGGAAIGEIIIATAGAVVVTSALLALGVGHRTGRLGLLGRASGLAERLTGAPGWAALPSAIGAASLLIAVFGMYWDISLHIDVGRDDGPLANPAHYFILAGLFGIFSAGFVAMVLPLERPSATSVRIAGDWHAPLGGVLICACGAFSLLGFPLDDVWHRIFGQDVTLWGPTHLMLIGGAAMTLVGIAVLHVEGERARATGGSGDERGWVRWTRLVALTGGLLIGLSTFQAEFDFGVPQFRFVFQPLLVMLAGGAALVAARIWLGRGAALGAVAFFIAIRGLLALAVGPVLGQTTPHFPLFLAEAVIVELVALRVPRQRPLALGLWSGALIGTVGLAAEWAWSHVWMPIPWPAELFPEGAVLGLAAAICGALIGAWIGARLSAPGVPRTRPLRLAGALAALLLALMIAFALQKPADTGVTAQVDLDEVRGGANRAVSATVSFEPPEAADGAEWLTATAWQGGGLLVDRLEQVGPGVYRTTEPVPVHDDWKALIRLHSGNSLTAVPIYLPEDPAIPAKEVPARPEFTRELISDHQILQREQKSAPAAITAVAYGVVLAIALGLLGLIAWGIHRIAAVTDRRPPSRPVRTAPERRGRAAGPVAVGG